MSNKAIQYIDIHFQDCIQYCPYIEIPEKDKDKQEKDEDIFEMWIYFKRENGESRFLLIDKYISFNEESEKADYLLIREYFEDKFISVNYFAIIESKNRRKGAGAKAKRQIENTIKHQKTKDIIERFETLTNKRKYAVMLLNKASQRLIYKNYKEHFKGLGYTLRPIDYPPLDEETGKRQLDLIDALKIK